MRTTAPRRRILSGAHLVRHWYRIHLPRVSSMGGPRYFYPSGECASPRSVIVVDDDFAIQRTIAEILVDEGYDVRCASDGVEALALLIERGLRPELIILDLWMRSMDGLEFRARQKNLSTFA